MRTVPCANCGSVETMVPDHGVQGWCETCEDVFDLPSPEPSSAPDPNSHP